MPVVTPYDIKQEHPEYTRMKKAWRLISDCVAGEDAVKAGKETYLPFPVALDDEIRNSDDFKNQYSVYLDGAHYTNFTEQAVEDLVAGCFRKDLIADVPAAIEYIDVNTVARDCVRDTTAYGRMFIYADYPNIPVVATKAEERALGANAYIVQCAADTVINWEEQIIEGQSRVVRVVIAGKDEDGNNKWTELLMVDGAYVVRIHIEKDGVIQYDEVQPKASGNNLDRIPGTFIGSVSNSVRVDRAPVLGIAKSNIKHYQTWAELSHVQTYAGHPQVAVTGLPPGWLNMAEAKAKAEGVARPKVKFGASNAIMLEGTDTKVQTLTLADSNLVHFKTLEQLEKSMLEQGARIKYFNTGNVAVSNATLRTRASSETSQLAKIATNVEDALQHVLGYIAAFEGAGSEQIEITINKEFFGLEPDASLLTTLNSLVTTGSIPREVLWDYMRTVGLMPDTMTDELLNANIENALP